MNSTSVASALTFANIIRGWRAPVLLILLCLVLYLPGLATLPPTDRDEARFTQIGRAHV